eukprot:TRINITY_DN7573_c1_g1_i1.p1 TRINITY_DN7573_c1_g1~~TRINITY_DN7573_c1_g1_i1.p1  ORF type:complete len:143 (+),score=38.33 TRINITY_DN7573_c1_g1_i1:380-808(+)
MSKNFINSPQIQGLLDPVVDNMLYRIPLPKGKFFDVNMTRPRWFMLIVGGFAFYAYRMVDFFQKYKHDQTLPEDSEERKLSKAYVTGVIVTELLWENGILLLTRFRVRPNQIAKAIQKKNQKDAITNVKISNKEIFKNKKIK